MAVLGLRFCARAFSSCGERGLLFIVVRGPLTIVASLVAEHRLQTRRLSSCGSWAQPLRGTWDPPDQGPNPCPPHRQADSQPPRHQGSPSDQEILCPPTGVCFGGCRRYIYLEDYSKVNDTKESNCCVLKVQTEREVCALDPKAGTSKF